MKNRDYNLVKDGKYNMKAIMQRAWVYVHNYRYSLKSALHISWVDAHIKMNEYIDSLKLQGPVQLKQGNVLKAFFVGGHSDYENYDSSWR